MSKSTHRVFRVVRAIPEGSVGATLILDAALPARPGQFVMVWLPGIEERPFTVMDDDPLSLTVAHIGPFTAALAALQPGDRVWVRGPMGHGFDPVGNKHLLVGGGSGTASLTLLAKRPRARGDEVVAAIGARTADSLMLAWRLEELGCRVVLATDDGSAGHHDTVLDAIAPLLGSRWPDAIYGCGPEPMLRGLARRAAALDIPAWVSMERVMKCGLGVCGACHCGDRLVCADGPVFPADEFLQACGDNQARSAGSQPAR